MSVSIPPAVAATCDPFPQVNPGHSPTARDDAAIARGKNFAYDPCCWDTGLDKRCCPCDWCARAGRLA